MGQRKVQLGQPMSLLELLSGAWVSQRQLEVPWWQLKAAVSSPQSMLTGLRR